VFRRNCVFMALQFLMGSCALHRMMNNEHWWKDKDRRKQNHSERELPIPNPHSVVQS
jgi:hypothetical protein